MDNNGIDTNEDLIDLRDKLTVFILDCFDHSDLTINLILSKRRSFNP